MWPRTLKMNYADTDVTRTAENTQTMTQRTASSSGADSFVERVREIDGMSATRIQFAINYVNASQANHVLELGIWKGDFSSRLLKECPGIETYWMLDPWRNITDWNKPFNVSDDQFEAIFAEAMSATEFAGDKRRILRGTTTEEIHRIPDGSLDLAYIDGDHTLKGITIDMVSVWPKVREGGVVLGDDFCASIWQHHHRYEPTMVFPFAVYFAEAVQGTIVALSNEQFILQKAPEGAGFAFHDPKGFYTRSSVQAHVAAPALERIRQSVKSVLPKGIRDQIRRLRASR